MLNRLSIRYKIGLIALIGLLGFVVFQTASYRLSINLRDQMQSMISEDFALLQFPNEVQANFSELDKLYQAALIESDMDTLLEADAKAAEMKLRFESIKTTYKMNDAYFIKLIEYFDAYVGKASSHTAAVITKTLDYDKTLSGYTQMTALRERYHQMEKQFIDERYKAFEKELRSIEQQEAFFVQFGLVLGVSLSIILIFFSLIIIRRLINAFSNAVMVAEQIANGNLDQKIETVAQDETGHLITSLTVMRDVLKRQKEEDQHRAKVQGFLAGLNEVMRGDKSLEELTAVVLDYLVREMQANAGIFYVYDGHHLTLLASRPDAVNETARKTFELGEDVVGRVGKDQRVQVVINHALQKNVNTDNNPAEFVLLFPLVFEGKLKGVIEIRANHSFMEDELASIHRCNDAIAIAFNSAQSRFKVASMLQQTQQQADELKRQRQELALFNRQLEEKTFYLDSQRNEILEKNKELELSGRELIEKSKALELSGRYKSQFLSTMSHELRTPLNSILILSDALMENRSLHLDDRELQHVQVINNAGAELLALINDILDLSKVEEGKMELVIDEIAMDELVTHFSQQFEYIAKDKGLDFVVTVAPDVPAIFYTDRHRLKQIIKNFISNALKFTETGGVYLDILLPDATFKNQYGKPVNENSLLFRVRDTGVGIDKNKQSMVFEAFKQADGTTSRKYGGTGLGLTISLALAKLLGGDIVLQSEGEGKGSSFTLIVATSTMESAIDHLGRNAPVNQFEVEQYSNNTLLTNKPADYRVRDEFLLLIGDKDIAESIIKAASQYYVDCHWEKTWPPILSLLQNQRYSIAFVELNLLGDDPYDKIDSLVGNIDSLYIVAPLEQQQLVIDKGCHFVPQLKNKEEIAAFVLQVIEYQQAHSSKVLVIEDNPVFQQVLRTVFTSHQLNVTIASDGKQALDYMQATPFDCLIVDLNLPDYQGTELLQKIRSNPLYQTQPVIVFTAEDLSNERQKEIKRYASQILLKTPNIIVSLYENVKNLIYAQHHPIDLPLPVDNGSWYTSGILQDKCLLLVDDDVRNIYSMSAMLESEGVKILSAKSGREALDILKIHQDIDLVLLDIMMPEMDGYEVLKVMRNDLALKDMPVITVTAKAMMGDREKCMEAGATDYLSKPVNKQVLLSHIVSILVKPGI